MAKNLFDSLSPAASFAQKLFAAAGIDFAGMVATGDETALKKHIESISAGAGAADAIQQATAKLQADLAERESQLTAALARSNAFVAAAATHKITFAADATPEQIGAAIDSRVSILAAEHLAKAGVKDLVVQTPAADPVAAPAAAAQPSVSGFDRVLQHFSKTK